MDTTRAEATESLTDVLSGTRNILFSIDECLDNLEGAATPAQPKAPSPEGLNGLSHECREQAQRLEARVASLASRLGHL